jgi:hypothetical protein
VSEDVLPAVAEVDCADPDAADDAPEALCVVEVELDEEDEEVLDELEVDVTVEVIVN